MIATLLILNKTAISSQILLMKKMNMTLYLLGNIGTYKIKLMKRKNS